MNLRLIFVLLIIVAGSFYAALGAFEGLLFYLWYAYFRPDHWTYGPLIGSLNLSLIIAIYVVLRTIMRLPDLRLGLGTLLIWAFFFQAFIGTITSESPILSWNALDVFSRVALFAYLIVILVTDRTRFRLVLVVMSLSLGFDLAKQGYGDLWFSPGRKNENPVAFLGDNNGVAMGLLMLFPLTNALVHTSTQKWEKYVHRVFAFGVLLRAISTYSRGGFLGAGALAVLTILRSEKKLRAAIGTVVIVFCVAQLMPQEFWDRMDTITVEEGEVRDDSSAGRIHFWEVAVDMANAKPMTGVGLGAYNTSYETYNYDGTFPGQRAAHSVWFGVLGELGYPGLILLIANLAWSFWCCWRVHRIARKQKELRELRVYANALISALVVFCVSGTFLSAQTNEMFWHLVGLSTALRFIATEEREAIDSTDGQLQKVA